MTTYARKWAFAVITAVASGLTFAGEPAGSTGIAQASVASAGVAQAKHLERHRAAKARGYYDGEVVVGYAAHASPDQIDALERTHALTLLDALPQIAARHYRLPAQLTVDEAIERIGASPIVRYAERNVVRRPQATAGDPEFANQWYLVNTGQRVNGRSGPAGIDIRWSDAMTLFTGTTPVTVAVIDTGVAILHPDFAGAVAVNAGEATDGADNDGNGFVDDYFGWDFVDNGPAAIDQHGHGTGVAAAIAATASNGVGTAGVSPTARILPVRVCTDIGMCEGTTVAKGLLYAGARGARVVNLSLGDTERSQAEYDAIAWLDQKGVLVLAGAGNGDEEGNGLNNDAVPFYPASFGLPNQLSIAAIDRSGYLARFSNYGPRSVHLAAPGTDIVGADISRRLEYANDLSGGPVGWFVGTCGTNQSPLLWAWGETASGPAIQDSVDFATVRAIPYRPNNCTYATTRMPTLPFASTLVFTVSHDLRDDRVLVRLSRDNATWTTMGAIYADGDRAVYFVDLSGYDYESPYLRLELRSNSSDEGDGIYVWDPEIWAVEVFQYTGREISYRDGTSRSTPIAAGVAALLMSQRPDLSHHRIRQIMLDSATRTPPLGGKIASGLVNAAQAMRLAIASSGGGVDVATAVEYFHAGFGHYFVTPLAGEIASLDSGRFPGWARTGQSFGVYRSDAASGSPVCRYYRSDVTSHFYSVLAGECATAATYRGWVSETANLFHAVVPNAATGICPTGATPLYRLWNRKVNHRYTTSTAIRNQMIAQGCVLEGYGPGVAMCVPE